MKDSMSRKRAESARFKDHILRGDAEKSSIDAHAGFRQALFRRWRTLVVMGNGASALRPHITVRGDSCIR